MPKLRTEVSTGQFPEGRECECPRCGTRFIDLATFDEHLPADAKEPLACPLREHPSVTVSESMDPAGQDAKSDPLTRAFAPTKRHQAATNRYGARGSLTIKAGGRCRKGLHRKIGPGSCLRCQADRQRDYRRKSGR
jgi:hypothetical protein